MSDKMTKSDIFAEIRDVLAEDYPEYADFCQHEIDSLAAKAEKARERAAAKRAEGDEYKAIVVGALTDEFQTGQAIFDQVGDEELTLGKVRARLTALVKEGTAVKEEVKVEKRSVMAYKLA